ncbi:hypothetical protein CPB86DRAFT_829489 [Serendipita vermifera]|nr:hypothetical protein CPB86DRAFT_829489 [Serendipita vermifera]
MSASSLVPTEIWQTILRYSISVPVFLDPDAVEAISPCVIEDAKIEWNDEKPYWQAERTRVALQRVCKSWNRYLRLYEHRLIRMIDIAHGFVSPDKLQNAIRLSLRGENCKCQTCADSTWPICSGNSFEAWCWNLLNGCEPTNIRILDGTGATFDMRTFPMNTFPELETLFALHCSFGKYIGLITNHLPHLRHCLGRGYWGCTEKQTFNSQTVKTLFISFPLPRIPEDHFTAQNWRLPGLRHIRIKDPAQGSRTDELQASLWALLKVIGQQLTSLYLPWANSTYELHSDIWNLCPNLEHLYTAMKLTRPPPFEHPIHTLCIASSRNYMYLRERPFPDWINLRIIRTDVRWDRSESLIYSMAWVTTCAERNIRLEDGTGESYDEFIKRTGVKFDERGHKIQDKSEGEKSSTYSEHAPNAGQEAENATGEGSQPVETAPVASTANEAIDKEEEEAHLPDVEPQPPSSPLAEDPADNAADNEVTAVDEVSVETNAPTAVETESPLAAPFVSPLKQDSILEFPQDVHNYPQPKEAQSAEVVTPKESTQEADTTQPLHSHHESTITVIENEGKPAPKEALPVETATGGEKKEKENIVTETTDSPDLASSSTVKTPNLHLTGQQNVPVTLYNECVVHGMATCSVTSIVMFELSTSPTK